MSTSKKNKTYSNAPYEGVFRPNNPKKYVDSRKIIYRSSWERESLCLIVIGIQTL